MHFMTGSAGPDPTAFLTGSAGRPITEAAFADAMAALGACSGHRIAVAVSGGADSMALLLLLADWCRARRMTLTALTVDHRLRDQSAAEAARVAGWCAARAVAHVTLPWTEGAAQRLLARSPQAAARTARYDLMTAYDLGIKSKVWVNRRHEPANPFYQYTEIKDIGGLAAAVGLEPALERA